MSERNYRLLYKGSDGEIRTRYYWEAGEPYRDLRGLPHDIEYVVEERQVDDLGNERWVPLPK